MKAKKKGPQTSGSKKVTDIPPELSTFINPSTYMSNHKYYTPNYKF
jgi:hypothetical protein